VRTYTSPAQSRYVVSQPEVIPAEEEPIVGAESATAMMDPFEDGMPADGSIVFENGGYCHECGEPHPGPCDIHGCYPGPGPEWWGPGYCSPWWWRDTLGCLLSRFEIFLGVHGFKGPADLGRNGNFGFHEGCNFGGPLGDPWGIGYQIGFQAVHSNFSGSQTFGPFRASDRTQIFLTTGLFRRQLSNGFQWAVAFDYLHDSYHGSADLRQLRSETSLVLNCIHELGFWGAYALADDRFSFNFDRQGQESFLDIEPNDIYAFFYRRHFSGGGQGRIWAGFSGQGDGLIGADGTVPLGTNWALQNSFIYLVPKHGNTIEGHRDETWSVTINLVWYPGRAANMIFCDPFYPVLPVADNTQFLLRRP